MEKMKGLQGIEPLTKAAQKMIAGGISAARACPAICIRLYISDADNIVCYGANGFVGQVCGGKCCH